MIQEGLSRACLKTLDLIIWKSRKLASYISTISSHSRKVFLGNYSIISIDMDTLN